MASYPNRIEVRPINSQIAHRGVKIIGTDENMHVQDSTVEEFATITALKEKQFKEKASVTASHIGRGAKIWGSQVNKSTIARATRVERNSVVDNCTVAENVLIYASKAKDSTLEDNSYLTEGADISGCEIGQYSWVGAKLENSKVGPRCYISHNATVAPGVNIPERAILDRDAVATISPKVKGNITYADNQITLRGYRSTTVTLDAAQLEKLEHTKPKGMLRRMFMNQTDRETERLKRQVRKNLPEIKAEIAEHTRDVQAHEQELITAARDDIARTRQVEQAQSPAPQRDIIDLSR